MLHQIVLLRSFHVYPARIGAKSSLILPWLIFGIRMIGR
jgi:hypothetical protein